MPAGGPSSALVRPLLRSAQHPPCSSTASPNTKHLGTYLRVSGSIRYDMRCKFAQANSVVAPLTKPVFRRQNIELPYRAALLDTLAMTRATYAAGIWHSLTAKDEAVWIQGSRPHLPCPTRAGCQQRFSPVPGGQSNMPPIQPASPLGTAHAPRLGTCPIHWPAAAGAAPRSPLQGARPGAYIVAPGNRRGCRMDEQSPRRPPS